MFSTGHGSPKHKINNNNNSSKKTTSPANPPPKPPAMCIQQAKHHYEQVQVQMTGANQAHYYSPLDTPGPSAAPTNMYHTLSPPTNRGGLVPPARAATNPGVYNHLHEAMSGRTLLTSNEVQKVGLTKKLLPTNVPFLKSRSWT